MIMVNHLKAQGKKREKKSKPLKDTWIAAVCYDSVTIAKYLRGALEDLDFKYTRDKAEKPYTKLMAIIPLPRFAYTFQFKIQESSGFVINVYDTRPTPSGILHFIEVQNIDDGNIQDVKLVLKSLAAELPRKPWKFFWMERFKYALAAPEYIRAKKAWNKMGVT